MEEVKEYRRGDSGKMAMYVRFGEFDSFGEINELAENLFNEGDFESIKILAKENGIAADFVDMYMDGDIPVLCDPMTAAIGKLDVEAEELQIQGLMTDWVTYIKEQCADNAVMAYKVRGRGKSLSGCIAALLAYSFGHQWKVPEEIKKAAGINSGRVTFGIPAMREAKRIITDYYLG